ncbi:universal stress protein [Desulfoferrobacter suflitae]|uniref:universal stress protein n=1 Tax=Desulfoferrobacter suflitae TaxID=2865782 RepID=UPI0021647694|nr:universal stress protein [Desulfoferrobacter suflitae]MCK8601880.1 universal stress protein [Desulfoferrobacter suflitae]
MFKHILVPTDLTEKTMQALSIAVKMALNDGSKITLLHVIEMIEDSEFEEFEDFYEKLKKRAQKKMGEMTGEYEDKPLAIGSKIVYGKRIRDIVRFAEGNNIDLIVLSSHRVSVDNAPQGWGTISYKVSILSHCPVMLVK